MPRPAPPTSRVLAFDGLRAVAFILIFIFHMAPRRLPGGWIGVDLFFVLSGFLITGLLRAELQRTGRIDIAAFVARRSLRVVPALVCMLLLVCAYALAMAPHPQPILRAAALAASFVTNWARAFGSAAEGPLGHTWSLAIEEQFYLIWPLVMLLVFRRRPVLCLTGLLVATITWRAFLVINGADPERTYNGFDTHCDGLLLGSLLAFLAIPPRMRHWATRLAILPAAMLAAILLTTDYHSPAAQAFAGPAVIAAMAWLLVASREPGWPATLLAMPPLPYLGRISYGLYLWHLPVLVFATHAAPHGVVGTAMLAGLTLLLAAASFHLLERPILAMRDRVTPRPAVHPPASRSSDAAAA